MKRIVVAILAILCLGIATNQAAEPARKGTLRHVVVFKYKDGVSAGQIQKVEEAFFALKDKIPAIAAFESGTNNSPENLNKGLTHCYLITFKTEKDRDAYLVHPAHKAFVDIVKPVLDDVLVIDYWVRP